MDSAEVLDPQPGWPGHEGSQGLRGESLAGPVFPRQRHTTRWVITAAVVAVALVAIIAIVVPRHSGGSPSATPAARSLGSAAASGAAGSRRGTGAGPRKQGGHAPVTATQVFPQTQEVVDGITFTRVVTQTEDNCPAAANGAFAAALASAGCKRVIRATFVDPGKRFAVTAGVAVLPTRAAASSVDGVGQFGPDIWFTGLDGPSGSGASLVSQTVGLGYDELYRRFIFYALATYSDGHNPTGQASQVQMLTSLSQSFAALVAQPVIAGTGS